MGWGNIYRRRMKVFSVAILIYLDYKVSFWICFLSSPFFFVCVLVLQLWFCEWRVFNKRRSGLRSPKFLLYGKKLMIVMLSGFWIWLWSWKDYGWNLGSIYLLVLMFYLRLIYLFSLSCRTRYLLVRCRRLLFYLNVNIFRGDLQRKAKVFFWYYVNVVWFWSSLICDCSFFCNTMSLLIY